MLPAEFWARCSILVQQIHTLKRATTDFERD
jgi:hypothetical protein